MTLSRKSSAASLYWTLIITGSSHVHLDMMLQVSLANKNLTTTFYRTGKNFLDVVSCRHVFYKLLFGVVLLVAAGTDASPPGVDRFLGGSQLVVWEFNTTVGLPLSFVLLGMSS